MSKLTKVEWFKKSSIGLGLNEIYQSTGIMFAFVSSPLNGLCQCHEWVKCRDFLPDAAKSQVTNKKCSIYGFTFDPAKNPIVDLNKMRMMVTKIFSKDTNIFEKIPEFKQKIKSSLKLLNHFESIAGVTKSKITKVDPTGQDTYKSIFLFTGSVMWMRSPFLISIYSFLIRLGDKEFQFINNAELKTEFKKLAGYHASGKINDNDASYLSNSWDKLDLIIKNRSKLFPIKNKVHDIYWKDYNISQFHNRTGLDSLVKSITPDEALNDMIKTLFN